MKKISLFIALFFCLFMNAQIVVNGNDITKEVDAFEVWAFKKPFSQKESYFINYGQDKFRPHYYDHKTQAVLTADGEKFGKGEWLQLVKYLKEQGFEKTDERLENIGDVQGRVVTFERLKQ